MTTAPAKKQQSLYICQSCGYQSRKWMGRCPGCSAWESLVEEVVRPTAKAGAPAPAQPVSLATALHYAD